MDLCELLNQPAPSAEVVRAAIAAGADPDALCAPPRRSSGFAQTAWAIAIIAMPPLALGPHGAGGYAPIELAAYGQRWDLVRVLLDGGGHVIGDALRHAVDADQWTIVRALVDAAGPSSFTQLETPLAGDVSRLRLATGAGIRLDTVERVDWPGRLATDPAAISAFLGAGLSPEALVDQVWTLPALDAVLPRVDPHSAGAFRALADAVEHDRWDMVRALRSHGVPWECPGLDPVLADANLIRSPAGVARLLADGADPNARTANGEPLVAVAVRAGRLDVVSRLVSAGADLNAADGAALVTAAEDGRTDLVRALVALGADPTVGDAVSKALDRGEPRAAALLMELGARPGEAAIGRAISADDAERLTWLLDHGLPVDATVSGRALATMAVESVSGSDEVLDLLIARHAPLGEALVAAVERGRGGFAEQLLDGGADPGPARAALDWSKVDPSLERLVIDRIGASPPPDRVRSAAEDDDAERVELLIRGGARPPSEWVAQLLRYDTRKWLDRLALTGPELDQHWDAPPASIEWMLDHGADPNLGLAAAVAQRRSDWVDLTVARGADLERPGLDGRTPISLAAELREDAVLQALLASGAAYTDEVARYDVTICATDRLREHAPVVTWIEVRDLAREAKCPHRVRTALRR
ncbi:MAG: ankyrin repeat domain-containing protein [Myxococcota bacterium]